VVLGQVKYETAAAKPHVKRQLTFEAVFPLYGEVQVVDIELSSPRLVQAAQDGNRNTAGVRQL
jgi:hypothetical protein